jgi:hypothetical protein
MHKRLSSNAPALVVSMALVFAASPAEARIECRGNFQITKHGPISTPYCEERQIARVARSYGITVTDAQVRNNPNTKVWHCQIIGGDSRLKGSDLAYSRVRKG